MLPSTVDSSRYNAEANATTDPSSEQASTSKKEFAIIDVHLDAKTLAAAKKQAAEILKLDKDPMKALQKALSMPKYLGMAKK